MVPIASTVLSHSEGVSDAARARELYKYYQPSAPINADTPFALDPTSSSSTAARDDPSINTPVHSDITSSKISSPDTALTAFCQLTAWRTGAQRAMIGLIDAETQYFVAESTRTVDLVDAAQHGPGDDLWLGCSNVSKSGKLCERTIAVPPTPSGEYPSFVVNDLSKDDRFNQLPFVQGPPNLRFYAGVPLITKRGIAIGSLFIVHDKVRDGMPKDDIHFMGTMAQTIMKHMEMVSEVEQHRRGMKMSRGLASFVEGRSELIEADVDAEDGEGTRIVGQFATDSVITKSKSKSSLSQRDSFVSVGSVGSVERKEQEYASFLASRTEDALIDAYADADDPSHRPELPSTTNTKSSTSIGSAFTVSSPQDNDRSGATPGGETSEDSAQKILCSRAANLIRETFEVDGGCVFYDAQGGFANDSQGMPGASDASTQDDTQDSSPDAQFGSGDEAHSSNEMSVDDVIFPAVQPPPSLPGLGDGSFSQTTTASKKMVDVLGFSTPGAASIHGDELPGYQTFKPFDEKSLHTLLRRYPRGKMWTFDSDGAISSSSEEEPHKPISKDPMQRQKDANRRKARSEKAKADSKFLSRHFPGIRQLLFVPLWDAGRARWLSGCFVWSTEVTRILSKQNELSFLSAFGNSVMAEWSRIDTEIANQKKGDFIGSISHELRSPLHGILASAEFLGDEVESTFEQSMVETISSCGRTLLDTINHVLDFSKINHFERTWRKNKRRGNRPGTSYSIKSDLPMINLYADIDISVICEEVVESVFAGHIFQNGTAANFDMVRDTRDQTNSTQIRSPKISEPLLGTSTLQQPKVSVVFDVDVHNYQFTTQPGAFRRVVMNLLGNALKYTSHGYVRIKLSCSPMDDFQDPDTGEVVPRAMVSLTVTDTGKGIAPEFLRSKLFTPFAQENSLSSGTGLGLAIVKSIVHILEGEITIESEVGRGTQVRVNLPLLRELPKNAESASTNTPKSINSLPHEPEESITKLRVRVQGQRVSLHGFDMDSPDPAVKKTGELLKASVAQFITEWYGLQLVPLGQKAGIIISNEANADTVSQIIHYSRITHNKRPSIVVLCSHTSRFDRTSFQTDSKSNVGYVVKPVGPLKLGKAIAQCLEGVSQATPNPLDAPQPESDLSNVFEEMSVNPKRSEVLDNSRMAADSDNARKAIESPTPNALEIGEYPFPVPEKQPTSPELKNIPAAEKPENKPPGLRTSETVINTKLPSKDASSPQDPEPSFLLVDDNAINLTLLSTSIGKRNHSIIDTAMDGLAAVQRYSDREEGYDIVFMDISMPLLDGFGATKEIRALEQHRKMNSTAGNGSSGKGFTPALIIALTGLASSEDQARAAAVGVDLFLTKPVSFREVKKMLDNWEANRIK
ncbi:Hybrid signal transduction histidine kinase B [Lachnellula subtilissima]|uniref:histidine kinase n=1 Tax=Lachnellula subtilissima TaxID=602034 RepID=A0A8H8RFG6_9HELO|nr:Hybrid signal transduction histidine kinase B [Lachnellula subtilissima]